MNESNNTPTEKDFDSTGRKSRLSKDRALILLLIAATALIFYVCYQLIVPFIPAIGWAAALAIVAYPLHTRILSASNRPNLAAALTVVLAGILIVAPSIFVVQTLISQVGSGAEALKIKTAGDQWQQTVESNPKLAPVIKAVEPYFDIRGSMERAADTAASQVGGFVGGLLWVAAQFVITFFTFFYFLRDKRLIIKTIKSFLPLSQSESDRMFSRLNETIYATIYGSFAVSLVQGFLGGLMFWWLGLPAPLLWGVVMFLLSLVPVLGAPVVWIPAAIYLGITGDWGKALILTGWGAGVIGSIDNLLYPILVGDRLRMHPLLVFFSVIGGLAVIGSAGLVLGPAAVVIAGMLADIWRQRTA